MEKKIAVATKGQEVSGHFGHCNGFTIFSIKDNEILQTEFIQNPEHKPGFLPKFLAEHGVNVIISGGIGGGAVEKCKDIGIEVVSGASGDLDSAVISYLNGSLKSTGDICNKHQHRGECGGHHEHAHRGECKNH